MILFSVVFYGADFVAGMRAEHYRLHFSWETRIPFVPWAYPAYYSVVLLPMLVPLLARTPGEIRQWRDRMSIAIVVAGIAFVAIPAQSGFESGAVGAWQTVQEVTRVVAGRYNLIPSLHVGLMTVTLYTLLPRAGRTLQATLAAWAVVLTASTLLTHQHHLLDVATGLLLGVVVSRAHRSR